MDGRTDGWINGRQAATPQTKLTKFSPTATILVRYITIKIVRSDIEYSLDLETVDEKLLNDKSIVHRFVGQSPISDGIIPVILLPPRLRTFKDDNSPIVSGFDGMVGTSQH